MHTNSVDRHETTAGALTWALYLLATNIDAQERLRNEVRENLPSLDEEDVVMDAAKIEALPFLNAVIHETLRLYPGVPVTVREAMVDTSIMGYPIAKGTHVMLVPWAINRSPELWGPDANKFTPERWIGEGRANSGGASSNYSSMTFLHGPRSCIGQTFAKLEFKCLLAAFVGRIRFEMADKNEKVFPAGVITTKPAHGMHLRSEVVDGW
jgi:cytochrome P450